MLWDCSEGDARSIAGSLTDCPACGKERGMPTTTTSGPSNANAEEGETGYVAPEAPEVAPETPAGPAAGTEVPEAPKPAKPVSAARGKVPGAGGPGRD